MLKKIIHRLFGIHPNAMAFDQGLHLTGMPIVTLFQNDKEFNFILDTGSTDCIINSHLLDSIEHIPLNTGKTLHGIEGNVKETPLYKIPFTYKNQNYSFECLASDMKDAFNNIKASTGVTLHGILGSNFFVQYKYILDFKELIAYSKV